MAEVNILQREILLDRETNACTYIVDHRERERPYKYASLAES